MKGKGSGNDGLDGSRLDVGPVIKPEAPERRVSGVREIGSLSYYKRMFLDEGVVREYSSSSALEADEKVRGLISAVLLEGGDIGELFFAAAKNGEDVKELLASVLGVREKMMHALIYTLGGGDEIRDHLEAIYAVTEEIQNRLEFVLRNIENGWDLPSIFTLAEEDEPTTRRSA